MSLRTKLLAAVVGLNGVILLLALFLLLRSEADQPAPPGPALVSDLVELGGALAMEPGDPRAAQALLSELEASKLFQDLLVVLDERVAAGPGQTPRLVRRVHRLDEYLSFGSPAEELAPGALRDEAAAAFQRARQSPRNQWWSSTRLAVVLPAPADRTPEERIGLVAGYRSSTSTHPGLRMVYVVMVLGVILLTAVSFWLISRLVIRPLERITEGADRIASGEYEVQLTGRGTHDEFDRTIAAFNRMTREIGEYQSHLEDRVLSALNRMKKAEQHLAIAQRLAATGKLASGVAHEINNPLGGMKNAVRALARGDLPPEKTTEYLELVAEGLGRVEETVKKFLSFTPRRVEPRPTDLAVVVEKAVALARHRMATHGVTLELELPEPDTATVFGDPHELQQVALNLLLNAADAVAKVSHPRVVVAVGARGDDVVLRVADNGVGLDEEAQSQCFDLFFTTKEVGEGTGLGLAVAHTIVTNHGGRMEVESEPGRGAAFRVVLPAEHPAAADEPAPGEV